MQCAGGVEQDNNFFEDSLLLQSGQIFQQLPLLCAKLQIIAIGHIGLQCFQTIRKIGTLTRRTGKEHNCSVTVIREGRLHSFGIFLPRNLVDPILIRASAGKLRVDTFVSGGLIKLPEFLIDTTGRKAVLQSRIQAYRVSSRHKGGADSRQNRVRSRLRKQGHFGICSQGQCIVSVDQQRRSFRLNLAANSHIVGYQFLFRLIIGPVENLCVLSGNDFLRLRIQRRIDHCFIISRHRNGCS